MKKRGPKIEAGQHGYLFFTKTQTDIRLALCRESICASRSLRLKFVDCFSSLPDPRFFLRTTFDRDEFNEIYYDIIDFGWSGKFASIKKAVEGGFYPFVRCNSLSKPIDRGIVWIGTRFEYPRVFVNNLVANWLCPYSNNGVVMKEPFEPVGNVIANWGRLSNRARYPELVLPPIADLSALR